MIVAVPITPDQEADSVMIENAIQEALVESSKRNTSRKDITPFLLKRVAEITKGASLKSSTFKQVNTLLIFASRHRLGQEQCCSWR